MKHYLKDTKHLVWLLVVVVVVGVFLWQILPDIWKNYDEDAQTLVDNMGARDRVGRLGITVKAEDFNEYGITPSSEFSINTEAPMNLASLKKSITIDLETRYVIEQLDDKSFRLKFEEALVPNQILKIRFDDGTTEIQGWAFQVQQKFKVLRTYPNDGSQFVPSDSAIEVYFSKEVDKELNGFFTIEPKVAGTFIKDKNKVTFTPAQPLKANTLYKITVSKHYGLKIGEQLENGFAFSFETTNEDEGTKLGFIQGNELVYLPTQEAQVLKIYDYANHAELPLEIYKVDNMVELAQLSHDQERFELIQKKGFEPIAQALVVPYNINYSSYIELPFQLEAGYYYIKMGQDEQHAGCFVQVTDYQGYVTTDEENLLFWLVSRKQEVSGLNVSTMEDKTSIGITNHEGLLFAALSDVIKETISRQSYLSVDTSEPEPLIISLFNQAADRGIKEDYWHYLYTDRSVYLPTDTIHIFGYLQAKSLEIPQIMQVKLMYQDRVMQTQAVVPSTQGTYETQFSLMNYLNNAVDIVTFVEGKEIERKTVHVAEYNKPAYQITTVLDKSALFMGENLDFKAEARYVEGTPLFQAEYQLQSDYGDLRMGEKTLVIDPSDKTMAQVTLTPYVDTTSWYPRYQNIVTTVKNTDAYYLMKSDHFILYPRSMMIEGLVKTVGDNQESEKITIEARVHDINISQVQMDYFNADKFRGNPVSEKEVSITVYESYYAYKDTSYEHVENLIFSETKVTDDVGYVNFEYEQIETTKNYRCELRSFDHQGQETVEVIFVNAFDNAPYKNQERSFVLKQDRTYYTIGDEVNLTIEEDNRPITINDDAKSLIIKIKDKIESFAVTQSNQIKMEFKEEDVPLFKVKAIYFDGYSLFSNYELESFGRFEPKEKGLTIESVFDQEHYRPGDLVTMTINLSDKTGNPIIGDVNISVVDNKAFEQIEDYTQPLQEIYSGNKDNMRLSEGVVSYEQKLGSEESEMVNQEVLEIEVEFDKTIIFETITTNALGVGTFSFTLPDTIGTWRVSLSAIDNQVRAQKLVNYIETSYPLHLELYTAETYLTEDDIALTLKADGSIMTGAAIDIYYEIIKDNLVVMSSEVDISLGGYYFLPIGRLEIGEYLIKVYGDALDQKASLEKKIFVKDNRLFFEQTTYAPVKLETSIIESNQPVRLRFFNQAAYDYYRQLMDIGTYKYDRRLEYQTAGWMANQLALNFIETSERVVMPSIKDYWSQDGLFRPLPYAEGSSATTAEVILSGYLSMIEDKSLIESLKAGLYNKLRNQGTVLSEKAAALWGLSLLGEPNLLETQQFMANTDFENNEKAKMYGILALLELGDLNRAHDLESITQKEPKDVDSKVIALKLIYQVKTGKMKAANGTYEDIRLTRIERPYIVEELYYVQHLTVPVNKGQIAYTLMGVEEELELETFDVETLSLNAQGATSLSFESIEGDITLEQTFMSTPDQIKSTHYYTLDREYLTNELGTYKVGDTVLVKLSISTGETFNRLVLEEMLPAGLSFVGNIRVTTKVSNTQMFVYDVNDGAHLQLHLFNASKGNPETIYITYEARAVAKGAYYAEPTILKNPVTTQMDKGKKSKIVIE